MAEPRYPRLHPSSESSHAPHTPHRAIVDLFMGWPLCSLLRMAAGSADTPLCPPDTPALRSLHQDCQQPVQWASKCHQAHGAASVPTEMTHADTAVTAAYLRNRELWWWKASPQLVLGAEPLGSWQSCPWCATSMGFPWGCPHGPQPQMMPPLGQFGHRWDEKLPRGHHLDGEENHAGLPKATSFLVTAALKGNSPWWAEGQKPGALHLPSAQTHLLAQVLQGPGLPSISPA